MNLRCPSNASVLSNFWAGAQCFSCPVGAYCESPEKPPAAQPGSLENPRGALALRLIQKTSKAIFYNRTLQSRCLEKRDHKCRMFLISCFSPMGCVESSCSLEAASLRNYEDLLGPNACSTATGGGLAELHAKEAWQEVVDLSGFMTPIKPYKHGDRKHHRNRKQTYFEPRMFLDATSALLFAFFCVSGSKQTTDGEK